MSVGLDIGSKSIKVVELVEDGNNFSLKSAGAIGYSGAEIDKFQEDKEYAKLATTIKKLFHDAKIASRDVFMSLPETTVFTRIMKFPLLNDQEIASAVKWEAEEYIPIPINEAIIEHQILERREIGNPPQVLVLLIAVGRSLIEKYVKLAQMSGLSLIGVETELLSLVRILAPVDKTSLVIDFGAKSTDIAIAKDGQLYFSRSVPTAGEALTRSVAQALGVSITQADEYKRTYGLAQEQLEGKVGTAIGPIFKVIADEIKKAIHYYKLDIKGDPPSSIILSGGTSGLPGAVSTLTRELGTEVVIGNPFARVKLDPESSKSLANFTPLYSVSVGLAMR